MNKKFYIIVTPPPPPRQKPAKNETNIRGAFLDGFQVLKYYALNDAGIHIKLSRKI